MGTASIVSAIRRMTISGSSLRCGESVTIANGKDYSQRNLYLDIEQYPDMFAPRLAHKLQDVD
jgi:hypothetical protein